MDIEVLIVFIVGGISLILLISVFIILSLIKKKFDKALNDNQTVIRSLMIDKEQKIVRFFNRNDIKNVKTMHLDQFLTQFSSIDIDKFNNWLTYLLKKDNVHDEYLEIDVFLNSTRKKYVSILKAIGVVKEKKLIYIDSYLLPFINKNRIYSEQPVNYNNVFKRFNIYPTSKGFTINFKIAYLNLFGNMDEFNKLIYATLENVISEIGNLNNRFIIEYSKEDIMIFDYKSYDEKSVKHYLEKIMNRFNRYLEMNSLNGSIKIAAGYISNNHYQKNILKLSAEAIKLSEIALNKDHKLLGYKKNEVVPTESYLSIDEIVNYNIDFTYEAIYSVKSNSIIGYFGLFDRKNADLKRLFDSISNLYKQEDVIYVARSIFKKLIDAYSELDTKKKYSLFIDGQVNLLDSIMVPLNKSKNIKKINLVICVDEKDAYTYGSNIDKFRDYISKIVSKNVKVCLVLNDKNLILDNEIYKMFDYFLVNSNLDRKKEMNVPNLTYRVIVEKLLKYNKPIILFNVNDYDEIELLVRSGIEYISSSVIAPTEKTLSEPIPKIVTKIKNLPK